MKEITYEAVRPQDEIDAIAHGEHYLPATKLKAVRAPVTEVGNTGISTASWERLEAIAAKFNDEIAALGSAAVALGIRTT